MIIAGGFGKRLLPLTSKTPKPLLSVNGKSPLERGIHALLEADVKNIAITTGYLCDETEKCVFDNNGWITDGEMGTDLNVTYYRESVPMGTAGMVFKILPFLSEDFFVISGDVVFDFSLREMMKFHQESNSAVTVAAVKSFSPTDYGTIISKDGIITAFREKPSWKQVISTKINAGIYIVNKKIAEKYDYGFKDFASDFFPLLLSKNEPLACFETKGFWCDMGTLDSYLSCNMHFSNGKNVMGDYISISPNAQIEGSVIMNGVKVGKDSKINSSIIAEGASIGKGCVLENAIVGPYALICDNVIIKCGCVAEEGIVGKGKTISPTQVKGELFSDSGKIFLSADEEKNGFNLGMALQKTADDRSILLFHDGSDRAKKIYNYIHGGIDSLGGKAINCEIGFLTLASFSAMKKSALSIFVESSVKNDGVNITVFDENGITLSREDQITCEKNFSFEGTIEASTPVLKEEAVKWDAFFSYAFSKSQFEEYLSETNIFLNNTAPSRILSKIIGKKGGRCEFFRGKEEIIEKKDCFFIDESGADVFCITKKGERISKIGLLSIASVYYPQNNVSLPEHVPNGIKNLIVSNGGSFSIYGDSKRGRKKSNAFYNFDDGISITLGVLCAEALSKLTIDQMYDTVPHLIFEERTVLISGNKGTVFEKLAASSEDDVAAGLQKKFEKGRAIIVPQYQNAFKIFAEAVSSEAAEELLAVIESDISAISDEQ